MKLPIFIADAFTATAFRGNPAAVCLLENTLDEDSHQLIAREMSLSETAFVHQLIAREMNLSETAFVHQLIAREMSLSETAFVHHLIAREMSLSETAFVHQLIAREMSLSETAFVHHLIAREMSLSETTFVRKLQPTDNFTQSSHFGLRWFTPESEFPLCGHATPAFAAVLFHKLKNTNSTLIFTTMSGELKARRAEDGIVLDFPLYPAFPQDFHEVEDLIKAAIGDTLVQDIRYSPDTKNLMVRLSDSYDRSFLETLRVNTEPLPRMEKTGKVKGLILTLRGEPGGQTPHYDFYSWYFAPWVGVAEDPVTGSAHTILGPYWSEELGKKDMRAFQCSRRGGELDISLRPDGRVDLKGGAAIVLEGTLTV